MRTISIFGKNMPILAILMALLVIGTASAAVFANYATLSGNVDVTSDVNVNGIDVGGSGTLSFASPATFAINNVGDEPVIVELVTTIFNGTMVEVEDLEGIDVIYSVIEGTGIEGGEVLVPPGGLTVTVDFNTVVNTVPDDYTIQVDVNPYLGDETYLTFDGDNAMVDVTLTHKDPNYDPIGVPCDLAYIALGNEFYYALDATGLNADTEYSLIYYADKPDRFVNWGGDNPGAVIHNFVTDGTGDITVSGHTDLGIDLPHANDENYEIGAKVWVVLTADLTSGALPMAAWNQPDYLFEFSEVNEQDYTDLVHYIDTNK